MSKIIKTTVYYWHRRAVVGFGHVAASFIEYDSNGNVLNKLYLSFGGSGAAGSLEKDDEIYKREIPGDNRIEVPLPDLLYDDKQRGIEALREYLEQQEYLFDPASFPCSNILGHIGSAKTLDDMAKRAESTPDILAESFGYSLSQESPEAIVFAIRQKHQEFSKKFPYDLLENNCASAVSKALKNCGYSIERCNNPGALVANIASMSLAAHEARRGFLLNEFISFCCGVRAESDLLEDVKKYLIKLLDIQIKHLYLEIAQKYTPGILKMFHKPVKNKKQRIEFLLDFVTSLKDKSSLEQIYNDLRGLQEKVPSGGHSGEMTFDFLNKIANPLQNLVLNPHFTSIAKRTK